MELRDYLVSPPHRIRGMKDNAVYTYKAGELITLPTEEGEAYLRRGIVTVPLMQTVYVTKSESELEAERLSSGPSNEPVQNDALPFAAVGPRSTPSSGDEPEAKPTFIPDPPVGPLPMPNEADKKSEESEESEKSEESGESDESEEGKEPEHSEESEQSEQPEKSEEEQTQSKLDLNSASVEELQALPHIAEMSARLIVNNRPYQSVEEVPTKAGLSGRARHRWDDISALVDVRPVEG